MSYSPKCSVPNCSNTGKLTKSNVIYYRFPTNENMKQKWLDAIKWSDGKLGCNDCVCGAHFEANNLGAIDGNAPILPVPTIANPEFVVIKKEPEVFDSALLTSSSEVFLDPDTVKKEIYDDIELGCYEIIDPPDFSENEIMVPPQSVGNKNEFNNHDMKLEPYQIVNTLDVSDNEIMIPMPKKIKIENDFKHKTSALYEQGQFGTDDNTKYTISEEMPASKLVNLEIDKVYKMEYQFISGKRRNSKLLYVLNEKQLYKKEDTNKKHTVYKCCIFSCKARIAINATAICNRVPNFIQHNHLQNQEDKFNELRVLNHIKTKCSEANVLVNASSTVGNVREIFNSACQRYKNAADGLNFNKMQRNLLQIRNSVFKINPKTYEAIIDCYNIPRIMENFGKTKHSDKQDFYKGCFEKDGFSFCIFASEKVIELIQKHIHPERRHYLMDATFKICPVGCFNQFLIVYIEYMYQIIPFIFVLMSKKSEKCYLEVFQYIDKSVIPLECNSFMADFEKEMRNALSTVRPASNLYACWFHYYQAIKRQANKIEGFIERMRADKNLERVYLKFLCLALLPAEHILQIYDVLRQDVEAANELVFQLFLEYFDKQWIRREGPDKISVFDRQIHTTSVLEAYHSVLEKKLMKKGHFFKFVQTLQEEEFRKSREMKLLIESGGSTNSYKRRKYKTRHDKIAEASNELKRQNITPEEFLNRVIYADSNISKGFIYSNNSDGDDEDDNTNDRHTDIIYNSSVPSTSTDTQQSTNHPSKIEVLGCSICFKNKCNIVLLPCKHLKTCSLCWTKIEKKAKELAETNNDDDANEDKGAKKLPRCPYCNYPAYDSIQVYS